MRDEQLLHNIRNIYGKIARSALRAGRNPEEIRLIAVTKTIDSNTIKRAIDIGLRDFGENRVQEARDKISDLVSHIPVGTVAWHLIGHLQKNKAKIAVELFDLIHAVDSHELAQALNKHAEKIGKRQKILVQVKLSDEESKFGILKEKMYNLLECLGGMRNLKTEGLMTMPPLFDDPERVRPYFCELRKLRDELESSGYALPGLSMGMTNDFEVAIQEGATMVRVGTGIFGERGN